MSEKYVDDLVSRLMNKIEDLEKSILFKNVQISVLQTSLIRLKGELKYAVDNKV